MPRTRDPYPPEFRQQMVELVKAGRTPGELSREFDRLEGDVESPLTQNGDFLQALAQMGLFNAHTTTDLEDEPAPRPTRQAAPPTAGLSVFGQSVFSRATTQFQPLVAGPVDPGYMLGPGDQIQLILTGDVELAYPSLDVTREGLVMIPDVGQVFVNGLTLDDLRESLYRSLGAIYSGVRRTKPNHARPRLARPPPHQPGLPDRRGGSPRSVPGERGGHCVQRALQCRWAGPRTCADRLLGSDQGLNRSSWSSAAPRAPSAREEFRSRRPANLSAPEPQSPS